AVDHRMLGDLDAARKELRAALAIRPSVDNRSGEERETLATADLHAELAAVLDRQGDANAAQKERQAAIEGYSAVLKHKGKNDGGDLLLAAQGFWSQLALFRRAGAYRQALQLADDNAELVSDFDWLAPTFDAERGSLQMRLGDLAAARARLQEAQTFLDRQTP